MKHLKELNINELEDICSKIRGRIIDVMAKNGGHLASNLGVVELTVALHYVFDSPEDKFIFDVSHQTYVHKILTGRDDERFDLIRKQGGLSGFSDPQESSHDHFYAGHAGTAISLGLGMAHARDLAGEDHYILPIIGDATLTCGLALEALNNIPEKLKKFILVLNDNEMSISANVGGIKTILSRMLSHPKAAKLSQDLDRILEKIPLYGPTLSQQKQKMGSALQGLFSVSPFFEQYGLSYIGPVEGHDVKKLVALFMAARALEKPIIIHVHTVKGFGLLSAEEDPMNYHGAKPFDRKSCKFLPSPTSAPTFPKIFGKTLLEMGKTDPTLTVITPATSLGGCLDPFLAAFPERAFDVGIAEGHALTFAGGLAQSGRLNVVCAIYSTFLQRALDNLFHDVCLQKISLLLAIDRAGIAFGDGATHHGIYDISFLRAMPEMVICQPRDGQLLQELMHSAFSWEKVVALRYPNSTTSDATKPLQKRPLGKGEVLLEGSDLLIIALGHHVETAFAVAEKMAIRPTIVDPIFIKPLDRELLLSLLPSHRQIVVIEEHAMKGGLGSEIQEFLATHNIHREYRHFGIPEIFLSHGSQEKILQEIGLTAEQITEKMQLCDFV